MRQAAAGGVLEVVTSQGWWLGQSIPQERVCMAASAARGVFEDKLPLHKTSTASQTL